MIRRVLQAVLVLLATLVISGCTQAPPSRGDSLGTTTQGCCTNVGAVNVGASPPSPSTLGSSVTLSAMFTADPGPAGSDFVIFAWGCTAPPVSPADSCPPTNSIAATGLTESPAGTFSASVATTGLPLGSNDIYAFVFTDANGAGTPVAIGGPLTYQVDPVPSNPTTITIAPTPTSAAVTGQSVSYGATVTNTNANGQTPDGSVSFSVVGSNGFVSPPATVIALTGAGDVATTTTQFSTTLPVSGSPYTVTATYVPGSASFTAGTPASTVHTVTPASTTTTLVTNPAPSAVIFTSVAFTATVAVTAPGAGTPTGQVEIVYGDGATDVVPLVGGTTATASHTYSTCTPVGPLPCNYTPTARYLGDADFAATPAPGGGATLTLVKDTPTVTLTTNPTGPVDATVYGTDRTFRARVQSGTVGVPAPAAGELVSFYYEANVAGTKQPLATNCPLGASTGTTGGLNYRDVDSSATGCTFATLIRNLPVVVGGYKITAEYATGGGGANHEPAVGTIPLFTITPQPATTSVITSHPTPDGSRFGESVSFTATVTGTATVVAPPAGLGTAVPAAFPTGSVTFTDVTNPVLPVTLGTATLVPGTPGNPPTATLANYNALVAGTHTIRATYNPATDPPPELNYTSTFGDVTQLVQKAVTRTVIISSSNPSVIGFPVTFSANVAAVLPGVDLGGNSINPGATVTFFDGTTNLGLGTFTSNETWTFSTPSLGVGDHNITAVYGGNSNFLTSTSNVLAQRVDATGSPATITSSKNPSTYGDTVTFTATLGGTTAGVPTGTVTFKQGFGSSLTDLATATLTVGAGGATATFTTATLAGGTHGIGFVYNGDANHVAGANAALAQNVLRAATTTAVAVSPSPVVAGQPLTLTASVSAVSGAPTGTVVFKDGGAILGTAVVNGGKATITAQAPPGTHHIVATYGGDTSFDESSGTTTLVVELAKTALTVSTSSNPAPPGAAVTFTAVVKPVAPATGVVTGSVTFRNGASVIGTGSVANGVATFKTASLPVGTHGIRATFEANNTFDTSTATVSQIIDSSAARITLSSSPSPSPFGAPVTITAALNTPTGVPTGAVVFTAGDTVIGSVAIDSQAKATLVTTTLPIGTTVLTASYSGDGFFPPGTGSTTQVVEKGTSAVSVVSSANPINVGASVTFTATVTASGALGAGSVEFMDGSVSLGSVALSGTTASLSTATLTAGRHSITAKFTGNETFAASTSIAIEQIVNAPPPPPPPTTTPTTPGNPGNTNGGDAGAGTGLGSGSTAVSVGGSSGGCAQSSSPGSLAGSLLFAAAATMIIARRRRRSR